MPKLDFEGYRNDVKKTYEDEQYPLDVDEHQVPGHPSTFMKMVKGDHRPYQRQMMRDVKSYLQESFGMEL
jgi:hypothetical protein